MKLNLNHNILNAVGWSWTFQNKVLRLNKLENIYTKRVKKLWDLQQIRNRDFFPHMFPAPHYSYLRKIIYNCGVQSNWEKPNSCQTACLKSTKQYLFWKSAVRKFEIFSSWYLGCGVVFQLIIRDLQQTCTHYIFAFLKISLILFIHVIHVIREAGRVLNRNAYLRVIGWL
jgi:hypothetical protein